MGEIATSFVLWLTQEAIKAAGISAWRYLKRKKLKGEIEAAIEAAFGDFYSEASHLHVWEASTELGPFLQEHFATLTSANQNDDYLAIGKVLAKDFMYADHELVPYGVAFVLCVEDRLHEIPELKSMISDRRIRYVTLRERQREALEGTAMRHEAPLPPRIISTAALPDARRAIGSSSEFLLDWPTTLGDNNRWIDRPELSTLHDRVGEQGPSATILLGPPGSGKSALLAKLGQEFRDAGINVAAIKADTLRETAGTPEGLAQALGLPSSLQDTVRGMTREGKTLLLVDQLDALSELVDVTTGRLDVLLSAIRELSRTENLHIVVSSRTFEFRYDARLSTINAETLNLPLPPWGEVEAILTDLDIPSAGWPDAFKEMLRTPQHLKVFLSTHDPANQNQFNSYQTMLDRMWDDRISAHGLDPAVMELAQTMANDDAFWLPKARVQTLMSTDQLNRLIGSEILTYADRHERRVGFTHQTVMDHARVRAFIVNDGHLAEYVLARQDNLNVRPLLWSTLNYIREADPTAYEREMVALKGAPLRKHLSFLLVDFIGHQTEPSIKEQEWAADYFTDEGLCARLLRAAHGVEAWFDVWHTHLIPEAMGGTPSLYTPIMFFLNSVRETRREQVLTLIRAHWLDNDEGFKQLRILFREDFQWDDETFDWAVRLATMDDRND